MNRKLLLLPFLVCTTAFAETTISIHVTKKLTETDKAQPIEDLSGFSAKRGGASFAGFSCPDSSDSDGNLSCSVTCPVGTDIQLTIKAPGNQTTDRLTDLYMVPQSKLVSIKSCKSPAIVNFEYRPIDAILAEFNKMHPTVYAAISDQSGAIKPFNQTQSLLLNLEDTPVNRHALRDLSELASNLKSSGLAANSGLGQYEVGTKSILLSKEATQAGFGTLAHVTTNESELAGQADAIKRKLDAKNALTPREKSLYRRIEISTRSAK